MTVEFRALDTDTWPDLEDLFGPRGGGRSCWCMTWRLPDVEYRRNDNAANRAALSELAREDRTPGILAYVDGVAVGWCSVAPRPGMRKATTSRALALTDVDDAGVWAVVCFYVRAGHRRTGMQATLLRGAIDFAERSGARVLEAYPMLPSGSNRGDVYTGPVELYERAGFILDHAATVGRRVVMRREL